LYSAIGGWLVLLALAARAERINQEGAPWSAVGGEEFHSVQHHQGYASSPDQIFPVRIRGTRHISRPVLTNSDAMIAKIFQDSSHQFDRRTLRAVLRMNSCSCRQSTARLDLFLDIRTSWTLKRHADKRLYRSLKHAD